VPVPVAAPVTPGPLPVFVRLPLDFVLAALFVEPSVPVDAGFGFPFPGEVWVMESGGFEADCFAGLEDFDCQDVG
jgi:hypothetical protein